MVSQLRFLAPLNTRRFPAASPLVVGGCLALMVAPLKPAEAQLIGQSVTGGLFFGGGTTNFFLASNNYVPSGYGNSSPNSNTVVISEPQVEFGFRQTGGDTDTANFTNTQLIVSDLAETTGTNNAFSMTFSSAAFSGASLSKISDTFYAGGLTASISGNTITINAPSGAIVNGTTYQATFNVTPAASAAPEPGSVALLALAGLPAVASLRQWRQPGTKA